MLLVCPYFFRCFHWLLNDDNGSQRGAKRAAIFSVGCKMSGQLSRTMEEIMRKHAKSYDFRMCISSARSHPPPPNGEDVLEGHLHEAHLRSTIIPRASIGLSTSLSTPLSSSEAAVGRWIGARQRLRISTLQNVLHPRGICHPVSADHTVQLSTALYTCVHTARLHLRAHGPGCCSGIHKQPLHSSHFSPPISAAVGSLGGVTGGRACRGV